MYSVQYIDIRTVVGLKRSVFRLLQVNCLVCWRKTFKKLMNIWQSTRQEGVLSHALCVLDQGKMKISPEIFSMARNNCS